jgi:hypothetical protein
VPVFPSEAWCAAAIAAANADPESARAGRGFAGDVACVVDAPRFFAAWCRVADGRIREWRVLAGPAELDELAPAYVARAALATWRGLLEGTVDPVEAVLARRLRVVGDLQPLVERIRHKGLAKRVLAAVETCFEGEGR